MMSASESHLHLGDSSFVDEDYASACDAYASALAVEDAAASSDIGGKRNPHSKESLSTRFRALSHRSAALLELGRPAYALVDCEGALALMAAEGGEGGGGGLNPSDLRPGEEEACRSRLGRCRVKAGTGTETKPPPPTEKEGARVATAAVMAAPPIPVTDPAASKPVMARPPKPAGTPASLRSVQAPKYQYYQTDSVLTIAILEPNVKPTNIRVDFGVDSLTVILTKTGVDFTVICGTLYDAVVVDRCKVVHKDEKVLIKLRKKDKHEWNELFGSGASKEDDETMEEKNAEDEEENTKTAIPTVEDDSKPRAYASHRDWDAIERDLKKDEENEKPEGEEALNKLFRDIYGKASEDTKRAMVKSFQTSGGTVLSTNWDEVGTTDYEKERQAPKGMEWKDQDGNRLPQKDD